MIKEINLFRTSLYEYTIPDNMDNIEDQFKSFTFKKPTDEHEVHHSFSTIDKQVLNKLTDLKNHIYFSCKNYMREVLSYENEPEILSSWILKTLPKGKSGSHIHENSLFTGVYYPQHNPGMSVRLYNPVKRYFSGSIKKYSPLNCDFYDHVPKKNSLIIFNSNIEHRINPNLSNLTRYSLAFTVMPRGKFGSSEENMCYFKSGNGI